MPELIHTCMQVIIYIINYVTFDLRNGHLKYFTYKPRHEIRRELLEEEAAARIIKLQRMRDEAESEQDVQRRQTLLQACREEQKLLRNQMVAHKDGGGRGIGRTVMTVLLVLSYQNLHISNVITLKALSRSLCRARVLSLPPLPLSLSLSHLTTDDLLASLAPPATCWTRFSEVGSSYGLMRERGYWYTAPGTQDSSYQLHYYTLNLHINIHTLNPIQHVCLLLEDL